MESSHDAFERLVERGLEARKIHGQRPLPVLVAGNKVNLHLLLEKVKASGGYSKVSGSRKWGNVAVSIGLSLECGPSVKLVYAKYLKSLESGHLLNVTKCNEEANVKPQPSRNAVALAFVKELALDPGNPHQIATRREKSHAVERISARLRREDDQKRHDGRRRQSSKYSLRPRQLSNASESTTSNVPIGTFFQADVPLTVDATSVDEDSKLFLGRIVWSPKNRVTKSTYLPLDDQTQDRSQTAVKIHVEEKRRKLKLELGERVFVEWGFHRMGESLVESDKWTRQDQVQFSAIVRSCQGEREEKLWPELEGCFTGRRSRSELVCYLFNVYMLRKRAIQNRVHAPESQHKFDTDNEDNDIGLVI